MDDCQSIKRYLDNTLHTKDTTDSRIRIFELSNRIINYIFADNNAVRKGLGDIMGGQVLELEVDRLIEAKNREIQQSIQQGIEQGIQQGFEHGVSQERESSIRTLIQFACQNNFSKDKLLEQLAFNYMLSADEAENYISKYWK